MRKWGVFTATGCQTNVFRREGKPHCRAECQGSEKKSNTSDNLPIALPTDPVKARHNLSQHSLDMYNLFTDLTNVSWAVSRYLSKTVALYKLWKKSETADYCVNSHNRARGR